QVEMRSLHPIEYVLLVTPNEANRAGRGSDRFANQFRAVGYGGLGCGQASHYRAINVGAGSEIAKPLIDGEKFLRNLEHGGVDGADLQCDVSHVAGAERKKSDLLQRDFVGDQNLARENFRQ